MQPQVALQLLLGTLTYFAADRFSHLLLFAFSYSSRRVNLSKSQVVFRPFGSYTAFCLEQKEAKKDVFIEIKILVFARKENET